MATAVTCSGKTPHSCYTQATHKELELQYWTFASIKLFGLLLFPLQSLPLHSSAALQLPSCGSFPRQTNHSKSKHASSILKKSWGKAK